MISTLTILIDLCLIFAVWQIRRGTQEYIDIILEGEIHQFNRCFVHMSEKFRGAKILLEAETNGKLDAVYLQAKLAEKMADRAFNMASSANLGVVALQKALATPRLINKPQVQQNKLASNGVDKIFHAGGTFDWLRPILSDEEIEILDEAQKNSEKMDPVDNS